MIVQKKASRYADGLAKNKKISSFIYLQQFHTTDQQKWWLLCKGREV